MASIYLVGGAVRDTILNRPVKDRDWVVVGATPTEMITQGYQQVGKDFPVFLHPTTKEEYALARKESKSGIGHKAFEFDASNQVSLEEDLLRRDLTINAMAEDTNGKIIDPFNGQQDIQLKVLRHVSPAFAEDPLRVLRVARFAARYAELGFTLAPETRDIMTAITDSGELLSLSAERVWQETYKALSESRARVYFEVLHTCGALQALFPELAALQGVPQRAEYHPEIDTFDHVLRALDQACLLTDSPEIRFAVLTHDLGKGITPKALLPRHHGHENSGSPLVKALCKRYKVPQATTQLAVRVCEDHLLCHKAETLKPQTLLKILQRLDAFRRPQIFNDWLLACEADARGRLGFETIDYSVKKFWQTALQLTSSVNAQEFILQGYEGKSLGDKIHKSRLNILKDLKATRPQTLT